MRKPRIAVALALVTALLMIVPAPALAGNGRGKGPKTQAATIGTCTIDGNQVTGHDLPLRELINFLIEDETGTWGWVLGQTDVGTWTVVVPDRIGPTTYMFVSRTWGKDGKKYDVYASCSTS